VGELAMFLKERGITDGPTILSIMSLFVEMYARKFPEERIAIGADMMKKAQGILTDHKESN
jgi:hypothetical protein